MFALLYLERFIRAGADILSIHVEACKDPLHTIKSIRKLHVKTGVVINPETPVNILENLLGYVDMVLLMSVHPGFGGQTFISDTINKIVAVKSMIDERNLDVQIEVDGGVDLQNACSLIKSGVDILVAGNTIFASADPIQTIHQLKTIC